MKKLILIILFISFFIVGVPGVFAEENATESGSMATQSSKIEYNLVYPGMLPDNPLYFLKTMRDRAVSILISDKLKRAEFDLLASDKRLVAASLLAGKNKDALAVTTLSKSNNYMDQAITSLASAKKAGQNIDSFLHNVENSIKKHQEEVAGMKKSIDKENALAFSTEQKRLQLLLKAVKKLSPNR